MPYTINKSDGTFLVTVNDLVTDKTATSLSLPARGVATYGVDVAENFVYLVENFASTTAPLRPLTGQLWFDKNANVLRQYVGGSWSLVSPDGFGGTIDILPGTTILGATSATNRLGGSTGFPLTYNGSTTTITVITGEGKVIAVGSPETIPNASLPVSIAIQSRSFDFKARFPNGLSAGITLAYDSAGYIYAGSNQFNNLLLQVPYLLSGDDSGVANQLIVTVPSTMIGYTKYLEIESKVATTNTGATTITVNNIGVVPVVRRSGAPLSAGDLLAGYYYRFIYDGQQFRVDDAQANGYVGPTGPAGAIGPTGPASTVVGPTGPTGAGAVIVSGEGVAVVSNAASLAYQNLNSNNNIGSPDLISYYSTSAGHHLSVPFVSFAASVLSQQAAAIVKAPPNLVTITASGNYTPSAGARMIVVRGVGGGGSGATSAANTGQGTVLSAQAAGLGGGGGAAGAFVFQLTLTNYNPIAVVIGAGGISPTANSGAHGNSGGTTTFGAYASATGGTGGTSSSSYYQATTNGAGGPGGIAYLQTVAGLQGYVMTGSCGGNAGPIDGGEGAGSLFGGGGTGGNDVGVNAPLSGAGGPGGYGAGGGGADHPGNSQPIPLAGNGGNGFVEIWEFF